MGVTANSFFFFFSYIVKSRSSCAGCNTARTESFVFLFFIGFSFAPEEGASLTPARSRMRTRVGLLVMPRFSFLCLGSTRCRKVAVLQPSKLAESLWSAATFILLCILSWRAYFTYQFITTRLWRSCKCSCYRRITYHAAGASTGGLSFRGGIDS